MDDVTEREIKNVPRVTSFAHMRGLRSLVNELLQHSRLRDAVASVKSSKARWAGHGMPFAGILQTRVITGWIPRGFRRAPSRPLASLGLFIDLVRESSEQAV